MDINPKILKRFFDGKYSRNDFLSIKSVFEKPEKEAEMKKLIQNHWFDFNEEGLPEGDVEHVLDKIHHQILHYPKGPGTLIQGKAHLINTKQIGFRIN